MAVARLENFTGIRRGARHLVRCLHLVRKNTFENKTKTIQRRSSACYRFIPESVRWLLAKEKNVKAKGIVCRVAKTNNVKLSVSLLNSFDEEEMKNFNVSLRFVLIDVVVTIFLAGKQTVRPS